MKYELSYWEREIFLKGIDIAVIGSGLVGLSAAIRAKERFPNSRVVVLERGGLPAGASTRNAGFACFGSMTELLDDLKIMTSDEVWGTVERRWKGLQRLREIIGDEAMDFYQHGGYEMFAESDAAVYEECADHITHFNKMAGDITGHAEVYKTVSERLPRFGFGDIQQLIINQPEGQIHTGRMMRALLARAQAHGIEIMNGIQITAIRDESDGACLETANGWEIKAGQALLCSNGFAQQLLPNLEVAPARNQVLVTHPVPNLKVEGCFHYDRGYFYFRNLDGRILLGGGRNLDFEVEKTTEFGTNDRIRTALLDLLHTVICPDQEVEVDIWWTGIMGLGPVKKPIVERVSPHVVAAVRLSGMGVAIGSFVGTEGADLL
jgi:hypothetical protein